MQNHSRFTKIINKRMIGILKPQPPQTNKSNDVDDQTPIQFNAFSIQLNSSSKHTKGSIKITQTHLFFVPIDSNSNNNNSNNNNNNNNNNNELSLGINFKQIAIHAIAYDGDNDEGEQLLYLQVAGDLGEALKLNLGFDEADNAEEEDDDEVEEEEKMIEVRLRFLGEDCDRKRTLSDMFKVMSARAMMNPDSDLDSDGEDGDGTMFDGMITAETLLMTEDAIVGAGLEKEYEDFNKKLVINIDDGDLNRFEDADEE